MLLSLLPMTGVPAVYETVAIEAPARTFEAWMGDTQAHTWVVGGMFDQNQAGSPQLEERYASMHGLAKTGLFLYIGGVAVGIVGTFMMAGAILNNDEGALLSGALVYVGGALVGLVGFGLMLGGSFGARSALGQMGSDMTPTLGIVSVVFYGSGLVLSVLGNSTGNTGLSTVSTLCSLTSLVTGLVFYAMLKPAHDRLGQTGALGREHHGGWGLTPFVAPDSRHGLVKGAAFVATF